MSRLMTKELQAMLAAATQGPWRYGPMDCGDYMGWCIEPAVTGEVFIENPTDACLLALSWDLAREVLALRAEVERLKEQLAAADLPTGKEVPHV